MADDVQKTSARSDSAAHPVPGDTFVAARCGWLVDVDAGSIRPDVTLLFDGDRVADVLPSNTTVPEGAVLDLGGCVVAPGLIDLHTHLVGIEESGSYGDLLIESEADAALMGVHNARRTIDAGFTSVRDVGTFRAFADVSLRKAIEKGWVVGPRMTCAGAYITTTDGGGEVTGFAADVHIPETMRIGVADNADEVRKSVRRIMAHGGDFIKVIATGAVLAPGTNPGAPEYTEDELKAAVEEAGNYGTFVAAHAHGAEGIKRATRAGVRSIEHGSFADNEALALMAERGTYLVADVWAGDWMEEEGRKHDWPAETMQKILDTTETQRDAFRRARELGVRIGFGTDSGIYPHGMNVHQLAKHVELGMSPMAALRSATLWASQCLGSDTVGSLTPGRYADLVAVEVDASVDPRSTASAEVLGDLSTFATSMRHVVKGATLIR
ncbi:MAG TPA: amidohydrolase family protein [Actinomycetes bacterium]|nr:amidohydrolase family protein [Actinomycetes bacterium]